MADTKSPLRRWKRFFPAFGDIDATIESSLGCSRDEYRQARGELVEMLCDAEADDAERAEGLCLLLDQVMVEALETLRLVPMTSRMLTSTDIAKAVADLRGHDSEQVRGLARRVFDGWKASIEDHLATVGALLEKLSQIPHEDETAAGDAGDEDETAAGDAGDEDETAAAAATAATSAGDAGDDGRGSKQVHVEDTKQAAKIPDPPAERRKNPPGVCSGGGDRGRGEKTGDAKRKSSGGYHREEEVKRRREVPEMVEERPRKAGIVTTTMERSQAIYRSCRDERRSSTSTRHRVRDM